jgi:pyruvate/2-oxoglutarate dehydrogenase complex dihydrolipoamide acyltransferase (E2) component
MAVELLMPRLGWTMEEGVFVQWLKQDGERVQPGDLLFTIEGDKATDDIEAFDSGILRIPPGAPAPGTTISVGTLLGYLVAPGEAAPFEGRTTNDERRPVPDTRHPTPGPRNSKPETPNPKPSHQSTSAADRQRAGRGLGRAARQRPHRANRRARRARGAAEHAAEDPG